MAQPVAVKTPEWLNNDFLQTAIRSWKVDDTIEVLSFDIRSDFSDHFGSTMFQSRIEFKSTKNWNSEPETLSVVIKAKPFDEDLKMKIVSGGPMFETEIEMYNKFLPAINQLFERSGINIEYGPE